MSNPTPAPVDFDGWVMVQQFGFGVLLQSDIERIDTDHQDAPHCDGEGAPHAAVYSVCNPEEALVLCQEHVQQLVDNQRKASDYVIGALPAN